jgi:hypothetical protein
MLQDTPGGKLRGPTVASMLVHRSTWEAAGGFPDRRSAEDLLFLSKIEELGVPAAYAPSAIVRWELRRDLRATFRRFYVYSAEGVLAGRHRNWHHKIVRYYLFAVPFVALAVRHHPAWAAVPLGGGAARVAWSIWRRREGRPLRSLLNPAQFLGVALIVVTIDVATFAGWVRALLLRARRDDPASAGADAPHHDGHGGRELQRLGQVSERRLDLGGRHR